MKTAPRGAGFILSLSVTTKSGAVGGTFISADGGVIAVSRSEGGDGIFCGFVAVIHAFTLNIFAYYFM